MDPYSKSSFIPKKTIKRVENIRGRNRVYFISYFIYALFFATIVSGASVFTYLKILERGLEEKIAILNNERKSFDNADLATIKDWEYKLELGQYFFDRHVSPYKILTALENDTSSDVSFSSFQYTEAIADDETPIIKVALMGETEEFDSVAFQNLAFEKGSIFQAAELVNVVKSATGVNPDNTAVDISNQATNSDKPIQFNVDLELDIESVLYDVSIYDQSATSEVSVGSTTLTPSADTDLINLDSIESGFTDSEVTENTSI